MRKSTCNTLVAWAVQSRHMDSLDSWPGWLGGFRHWYAWESPTPALLRSISLFDRKFAELRHATMLEF